MPYSKVSASFCDVDKDNIEILGDIVSPIDIKWDAPPDNNSDY